MTQLEQIYQLYLQQPSVATDSRQVTPDCLFFALKGANFNGNEFAVKALENGAAYAIVDENTHPDSERCILVENALATLQQLATHHRRQFNIPVLAITGTNGKTTTKDLVSTVLASHYVTHFTKGNLNNHIGVPLTLLRMPATTEIAVIEMGANHCGDIKELCQIALPTHGLITNIGKAHLEGFGGIEGVKQTKSELYRFLEKNNGLVFINSDEPYLSELADTNRLKIWYQRSDNPKPEHVAFEVQMLTETPFVEAAFLSENGEMMAVKSQLPGRYNFANVMTAIVVGKYFKVPALKAVAALENYVPANNRSQLLYLHTNIFVLDAYNANPTSVAHALHAFSKMNAAKKVAILGAMLELGEYSEEEHEATAHLAHSLLFEQVVLVGEPYHKAASRFNFLFFENTAALQTWWQQQNFTETTFLVKGSRSIGLEKLLEI